VSSAYDLQSMSTLASSSKHTKNTKNTKATLSEDEDEEMQGNLVLSSKAPRSPERKLSNEDDKLLPPRVDNVGLLRPSSKFGPNVTLVSDPSEVKKSSQKPMSILGFMQKSAGNVLQWDSKMLAEKAGRFNQLTSSLLSSAVKTEASLPCFTLS